MKSRGEKKQNVSVSCGNFSCSNPLVLHKENTLRKYGCTFQLVNQTGPLLREKLILNQPGPIKKGIAPLILYNCLFHSRGQQPPSSHKLSLLLIYLTVRRIFILCKAVLLYATCNSTPSKKFPFCLVNPSEKSQGSSWSFLAHVRWAIVFLLVILVDWPLLGKSTTLPYLHHLWIMAISLVCRSSKTIEMTCFPIAFEWMHWMTHYFLR